MPNKTGTKGGAKGGAKGAKAAPETWGGGGLGTADKVKCGEGAKAWIADAAASFNTFVDRAKSGKAHQDGDFFAYAYGSGDLGLEEHEEGGTLAGALAPLRGKLLTAIKNNSGRVDKALERAIAALSAYGEEDGEEAQKKAEAEAQKKKAESARMAVMALVDGTTLALPPDATPNFLEAVAITPRAQTLEELVAKLLPLGQDRAKVLLKAALDQCREQGGDKPAADGKGMKMMMANVVAAKTALKTMGVKELTAKESAFITELVTAVSAFQQQYCVAGDSEVAIAGKMALGNVARLVPLLPKGVTVRYPKTTAVAVLMCDAELQHLPPGDPLRGSLSTILNLTDVLGGLQGTLVSTVAQEHVLELAGRGLSPAITLAAWQGGATRGAAAAMAALPADAAGGYALISKLLQKVRTMEGAGRHSLSLGGGGILEEGVQAVLAQLVLTAIADMAADGAAFTHLGQMRSDSSGATRSGRARGVPTAAPYPFLLWKALCFLAAGTAVFALSEQAANAVGGAGLLVYVPTTSLTTAAGKRGREGDSSGDEDGAQGAATQSAKRGKAREKKKAQKQRKKARGGAADGGAQATAGAQGAAAESSGGEEEPAAGAVAPREGFPAWDFFTRFPGKARYTRGGCEMRCCYCGSKRCTYGGSCPDGFPKEDLQAKDRKYDPQFKSRAELTQLYAAMKEKHRR